MGNFLTSNKKRCQVHELEEDDHPAGSSNNLMKPGEAVKNNGGGSEGGMKVKIVLTKEELDWLMYEMKVVENINSNNGGGSTTTKKLEDALAEIERNRALKSVNLNNNCWQPSLESITEIPEDIGSGRYWGY